MTSVQPVPRLVEQFELWQQQWWQFGQQLVALYWQWLFVQRQHGFG